MVARRNQHSPRSPAAGAHKHDEGELDPLDVAGNPRRLDRYVLLEKLGHGGMGVVYAAYDENLDRKVAIKILRTKASENTHQRLRREAQAMARLSHPNVVQIYESNAVGELTYVVMEFIDGQTLREWMAAGRRSRKDILEVFIAAGRGLAAAHAQGLIHRDFKPDNVMISKAGLTKVMDFGLARGDDEAPETRPTNVPASHVNALSTDLTADGAVIGTPAYMAPEQIEGRKVDARSDQFSFCVTLWEALFERRPFAASSLSEMSDVITAQEYDQPERSKVPGWLRRVLKRGLMANPAQRWPNMEALIGAIEQDPGKRRRAWLIAGAATSVVVAGLAFVLTRPAGANKDPDALAADRSTCELAGREIEDTWNDEARARIGAAFAATKLAYADETWQRAGEWLDRYALGWAQVRSESCFEARSEGREDSEDALQVAACLDHQRAGLEALLEAWSSADAQTVTRALAAASDLPPVERCNDPRWLAHQMHPTRDQAAQVDQMRAQLLHADALRVAGKFEAARELAGLVRSEAAKLGYRPLEARAGIAAGRLDDELGEYAAARLALRQAYLAAIAGGDDYLTLEAATWLALVVGDKLSSLDAGLEWGQVGLRYVERLGLGNTIQEAELLYAIGLILDRKGDYVEAQRSLERALTITMAERGDQHPDVARALNGLGGVYWSKADWQAALDTQLRSLKIVEHAFGKQHPEVARSLNNMGMVLGKLGKLDEARDTQLRALTIRETALGPEHPDVATTLNALGATYTLRGEHDKALDAHRRALRILEAALGPTHVSVAKTLLEIAAAQLGRDDTIASLSSAKRALELLEAELGSQHHDVARAAMQVGRAEAKLGHAGAAKEAFSRALAIREATLDPDHPLVAEAKRALE